MAEDKSVEKFDPSQLMQGVKDRIKATFVSLVPDDQWEKMVEREIKAFFEEPQTIVLAETERRNTNSYHSTKMNQLQVQISPFRALVWQHCGELTFKFLNEKVNMDFFKGAQWSSEVKVDEDMKKVIEEVAPTAAIRFFQMMIGSAMADLRNSLPQQNQY